MANYVFVYYQGAEPADMSGMSEEEMDGVKKAWGAWFEDMGDALVDGGNPFNHNGQAVDRSGVNDVGEWPATGYSIVKADSMEKATAMAKGCPGLADGGPADFTVRVYETMPM